MSRKGTVAVALVIPSVTSSTILGDALFFGLGDLPPS